MDGVAWHCDCNNVCCAMGVCPTSMAHAVGLPILLPSQFLACVVFLREQDPKRVYYMSMEFLMGRSLLNTLYNLGIKDQYAGVQLLAADIIWCFIVRQSACSWKHCWRSSSHTAGCYLQQGVDRSFFTDLGGASSC